MERNIGIFGGDDRYCYLANDLILRGNKVWVWELGSERSACPLLSEYEKVEAVKSFSELARVCQVLVGPVPFSKYLKEKKEFGDSICKALQPGQYFYAGGIPKELADTLKNSGVKVTDFLKEESFLKKNAELTAQGLVAEVMCAWKKRIKGAKVLVTGFGFCGREIAGIMRGVGADVTVCVRRMQSAWEAYEAGFSICYYEQLDGLLPGMDIVINTVPAMVIPEDRLRHAREKTLFVEIASAPGGFSTELAESLGMMVLLCPGLPGKYAPEGAALAMAECIV